MIKKINDFLARLCITPAPASSCFSPRCFTTGNIKAIGGYLPVCDNAKRRAAGRASARRVLFCGGVFFGKASGISAKKSSPTPLFTVDKTKKP